ncbi:MAG: spore coat associated protein CotJA [Bacillota bacterium]|nr:spore coat associated protein CotJA [Bacillota bacterium]
MANSEENKKKEEQADAYYYPDHMHLRLATAYVPPQVLREMFPLPEALSKGTLFPELYRPYP